MTTANSISGQLLRALLIPLCTIFIFSTVVAYNLAAGFANDAHDHELLNAAHAVAARLTEDGDGLVAELPKTVQAVLRHDDQDKFFYQVLDTNNQRVAGDAILPMPTTSTDTDIPRFRYAKVNGSDVRIARIRVPLHHPDGQIVVVQAARTLNARSALIHRIFLSIVIPQLVLLVLSVAAVWFGVRRGLTPLRQLSMHIQKRSQVDLTPIHLESTPREMVPIIQAINVMLGRIDLYVAAQQRFVANAAHQLRTPVAGLKAYIEYGRRAQRTDVGHIFAQLDAGTDRISELVAGLLVLARTGAGQVEDHEPVDLNDVSSEVTSHLIRQAANKQIELSFEPSSTKTIVKGDKTELREMISNLVDNAIRYTQDGGRVCVSLAAGPPTVLTVKDNGPGIAPAERERVFERFYRVLGTKVNGSGLGLAIVSEIAQLHNASVEIADPEEGGGTLVRVTFAALQRS